MQILRLNIKRFFILFSIAFLSSKTGEAQALKVNSHYTAYEDSVAKDSLQDVVEVKRLVPSIIYDLRYATKDNFTGQKLYKSGDKTFLRLVVVKALKDVSD